MLLRTRQEFAKEDALVYDEIPGSKHDSLRRVLSRFAEDRGQREFDEALFERLRIVRARLARERSVPAYIVFGDKTLQEMARSLPQDPQSLLRVAGVGERKLKDFGEVFLDEIRTHTREQL